MCFVSKPRSSAKCFQLAVRCGGSRCNLSSIRFLCVSESVSCKGSKSYEQQPEDVSFVRDGDAIGPLLHASGGTFTGDEDFVGLPNETAFSTDSTSSRASPAQIFCKRDQHKRLNCIQVSSLRLMYGSTI